MTHRSKKKRREKRRAEVIKRKAQFAKDQSAKKKPKKTVRPTIQLKKQGETVTAKEADRRSEERRKTATKTTVLPTIQLNKPKTEKRGFLETLVKGPKLPEGQKLQAGTLPFGLGGASTLASAAKFPGLGLKVGNAFSNAKTTALSNTALGKVFSKPAMAFYGAWASSVLIGLWATAEAPESIAFPQLKFLIADAERTGDWSLVDEAEKAKYEILDLSTWEKIIRFTPAAFILINKKIQGAVAGAAVTTKIIEDKKKQQEEGTTEADYWDERREEQAEQDKAAVDYYNEQRKIMVDWENEAKLAVEREKQDIFEAGAKRTRAAELGLAGEKQAIFEASAARTRAANIKAREEEAAFWRKERAKQSQMEAEDRKAIADFWLAYRKEVLKLANDNRPSNLNFGLL